MTEVDQPARSSPGERRVAMQGCANLRDLGGYRTTDGRVVRKGCLYRSDELCSLTDADLEVLADLGIQVVLDLRNDRERSQKPSRLWPDVELLERQSAPAGTGSVLERQIATDDVPQPDQAALTAVYMDMISRLAPELRVAFRKSLESVERPFLFHCVAGKDRTGLTAALLLGALGVPRPTIVEDYELSNRYYLPFRLATLEPLLTKHGVDAEKIRPIVEVRPAVLEAVLDHLDEAWCGLDGYVEDFLDLPGLPARLRQTLLVEEE